MNKFPYLASGAAVSVAALMAWSGWRIQQQALAVDRSSADRVASVREELRRTEERVTTAQRETARLQARLEQLRLAARAIASLALKSSSAPAIESDAPLAPAAGKLNELAAVARAKAKSHYSADNQRQAASVYQSFFRDRKLTPQQIEAFIKLCAMRDEREAVYLEMFQEGVMTAGEREKLRTQDVPTEHAAFRELLGGTGFQRLTEYNRSTPAREIIGSFGASAGLAGAPFTAAELDRLVDVVVASYAPTGGWWWDDRMYAPWQFQPIDWHLAEPRLRALMTDAQWTIFTSQNPVSSSTNVSEFGRTHMNQDSDYFSSKFRTLAYQAHKNDRAAEKASAAIDGSAK
jgi:hypothetical protein